MSWPTDSELDDLVRRFTAATVPATAFTHAAHLAVGTWHVHQHGAREALELMRAGIIRLNAAHGTPNTDTRGYHETITRAYLSLIGQFLAEQRPVPSVAAAVRAVLASPIAVRDLLLNYYSRDLLMSVRARRGWVEPDLHALQLDALRSDA